MVRASTLHVLCACPAKRRGVVMVDGGGDFFFERPLRSPDWSRCLVALTAASSAELGDGGGGGDCGGGGGGGFGFAGRPGPWFWGGL